MLVHLTVNGKLHTIEERPEKSLLEVLRSLDIHSVRAGCDTGNCGICTVWLDGTPILSCSLPVARADGHAVTTVEGVGEDAVRITEALSNQGADQCGYCVPGLVMTILAMEKELDHPSVDDVRHYLNGNLCRCSGYASQMRSIEEYFKNKED